MELPSRIQFAAQVAAFMFGLLLPLLVRKTSPLLATFPGDDTVLWVAVGVSCSSFAAIALAVGMLLTHRHQPILFTTFEWFAILLPAAGGGVLLSVVMGLLGAVRIVDPRLFAVLASSWHCAGISGLTIRAWIRRRPESLSRNARHR